MNYFILLFISFSVYSQSVTYKDSGIDYEGYYLNAGKNSPTIFIIHDWDGLTDYEIKRSQMLKNLGYSVFAIDLFGKGIRPTKLEDKKQHTAELYKDRNKMRSIMNAALNKANDLGLNTKKALSIGYCFGGAAVLEWARSGVNLLGHITFHGGLSTPPGQDYSHTKGEVIVYHGQADKVVSMEEYTNLKKELEKNKIINQFYLYPGADHAFTVYGGKNYQKVADEQSWKSFVTFLNQKFVATK